MAEHPDRLTTDVLAIVCFEIKAAKAQISRLDSQSEGGLNDAYWFDVFQRAQEVAASYHSEDTDLEHVLLALLQNPVTRAYKLLSILQVNQQRLKTELLQRIGTQTSQKGL